MGGKPREDLKKAFDAAATGYDSWRELVISGIPAVLFKCILGSGSGIITVISISVQGGLLRPF
jgi:hypothetical protein